jgi:DNA-binding CsgD family transcriptional regulator
MPLCSGILLSWELNRAIRKEPQPVARRIRLGQFTWRISLCVCLISLADGVVRAVFVSSISNSADNLYQLSSLWASLLTFLIIAGCMLLVGEKGLRAIYRVVMLIMALFFMLLPVFINLSGIESALALTGYGTFNLLIWILLAGISHIYRLPSVVIFGIGWGMVSLGMLFGSIIGRLIVTIAPFSPQAISLITLLATLCILVSYMFVFKEKDLEDLIIPDDETANEPRQQRFQERCRTIASKYHLTPKESEIMILFAKGRSAARIQQDLFISRGTCTTHLRHIYQKLGVHDKQEFLDIIEKNGPPHSAD